MMNRRKISPPPSKKSSRPQTVRSRAGSSPGLDNSQIHSLLNKKNSFASLLCKNNDSVADYSESESSTPPTRSMSVISVSSVVSPSSIDTNSSGTRFIRVTPAKDSTSISSHDSAVEVSPRNDDKDKRTRTDTPSKALYLDEIVWKIDDIVYAAGIDAATNMSLLCRFNIEFVCEIVDETTEHIQQNRRQNRGFDCPCLCQRQLNHFRYFVNMNVPESEEKCFSSKFNMITLFEQFLELVERGRKVGKNVLVCSSRGRNRAPTFCAAYLMAHERVSRCKAVGKVMDAMRSMRPPVNISDYMQRQLMRFQHNLGIEPEYSYDSAHSVQLKMKRSAWT
ncbi:unnamed protein product [Caenorhabditis angaria]|uniref:protein-tyrosine-phosphatase n=1 Tax=Caenorhabditis angaria TaxID=860376 RepID=A0A9P1MVT9_9PELO|nr:unnamed protein product [Caenorhabditis angaria]